jgi:hypothetical protein
MWHEKINLPGLVYHFKNIGRTVAIIREISDQLITASDFPASPSYLRRNPPLPEVPIVEPQKDSSLFTCTMKGRFTVGDAVKFQKEKIDFWFYGHVRFDDAFQRRHRLDYRFRYHRGYGGFRLVDYRESIEDEKGRP